MSASASIHPAARSAARPRAAGLLAFLAVALLSGCSDQAASVPIPAAVPASQVTEATGVQSASALKVTSSTSELTLKHWSAAELPVTFTGGSGPVALRMERTDGQDGDVIEVSPSTVTLGTAPTALKLRPTRVAFPSPEDAAPWKLVASQGGKDVASLDLQVTLQTVALSFKVQPVTAAEGQTV
uniref:hypothetical protein n=1 Tax=Deinococcus sp. TaxID=47478 RepID=UPI002869B2D5